MERRGGSRTTATPTSPWGKAVAFATGLAVIAVTVIVYGCGRSAPPPLRTPPSSSLPPAETLTPTILGPGDVTGPALSRFRHEPEVRVRVSAKAATAVLTPARGDGPVTLRPTGADGRAVAQRFAPPVEVRAVPGQGFRVKAGDGRSGAWRVDALEATADGGVALDGRAYPDRLRLRPRDDDPSRLDVINHLALEAYLPGVLEKELFPNWHEQAFRAQAVAARSFALFEIGRRGGRHFDLEATTTSQVYGGAAQSRRALLAVAATRGAVLTYDGRVVPAFYASHHGGRGQHGYAAFPGLADLAPLRGRAHGPWGSIAPTHRWGPVERDARALARRVAAWGRARRDPVARLDAIADLAVADRTADGRPTSFTITTPAGRAYLLAAEHLRYAANYQGAGLPTLPKNARLLSSDLEVTRRGTRFVFRGRGHGHGVGLDQYGAQHLAQTGYPAGDILAFYYPGAAVVRLY